MSVHVLVVDDEKEILNAVGNYLQLEGFKVDTAENGEVAIRKIADSSIQIVITDLMMPVKDGFELLAYMTSKHPNIAAIIMSANVTEKTEAAISKLGFDGILKKPFDLLSLSDRIMDGLAEKPKGFMQGVTLPAFLQLVEMEAKTCTLKVESAGKIGYLYFSKGDVFDAKTDEASGVEALKEILLWDDTSIEINHICLKQKKHIREPLQHILLDTLRLKDETDRISGIGLGGEQAVKETEPAKKAIKSSPSLKTVKGIYIKYGEGQSMVIPSGAIVLQNMNTYYLNIPKLLEFFTKSPIVGLVHFKSPQADAFVLFGEKRIESAFFKFGKESIFGGAAIEKLTETAERLNYSVDIQRVQKDVFLYWSGLSSTEITHKDLDSDFTSLQKLITKLTGEKLTGYIEVEITNSNESGAIFFHEGKIVGGAFSWEDSKIRDNAESLSQLIDKSQRSGATFTVRSVRGGGSDPDKFAATSMVSPKMILAMLQEVLSTLEDVVEKHSSESDDFVRVLKRKFVEKADAHPYLDPFAGEFTYENGIIEYESDTPVGEMCSGLIECTEEIADELDIKDQLKTALAPVAKKYPVAMQSCARNLT